MSKIFTCLFFISTLIVSAQDVSLVKQFGGKIDFLMIGNTMNLEENGITSQCLISTESSTTLNIPSDNKILAAYLYWAGSGEGDFDITLNGIDISAERTFKDSLETNNLPFFAAATEVTETINTITDTTITVAELDVSDSINLYCPNGTNFAGWSILVIYENENLPLNQINIYEGLEHVPSILSISLNNIDVIDNEDAKIGFIAWEGDAALSVNESLFINGNLIGNPPLNPANNAFNGTNSFTNSNVLYNMDIDAYDIENNINIGDTEAIIELTSGQDFVMINTVITKLNSQLPDATVSIDNFEILSCNEREAIVETTLYNLNSTNKLPENVSISIYANEQLLSIVYSTVELPIGGSESFSIPIQIPEDELYNFQLVAIVNKIDPVLEITTDNNTDILDVTYPLPPEIIQPDNLESCNIGLEKGLFDFSEIYNDLLENALPNETFTFYPSEEDYLNDTNSIDIAFEYQNDSNPQTIYIKATNTLTHCYSFTTFNISVYNCPPTLVDGFSPNNDGRNETFAIAGLYDIFTDFRLEIYNRWGQLVYEGNQQTDPWNGRLFNTKELVPVGLYYYVLNLNDADYKPTQGTVYVSR